MPAETVRRSSCFDQNTGQHLGGLELQPAPPSPDIVYRPRHQGLGTKHIGYLQYIYIRRNKSLRDRIERCLRQRAGTPHLLPDSTRLGLDRRHNIGCMSQEPCMQYWYLENMYRRTH